MMMFVQLLVFTCACALGATDEVPPYGDIMDSIIAAQKILNDNILSMDGNAPFLNDPRRHYAEIIHVVHDATQRINTNLLGPDYFRQYQVNINEAGPFAVAHPQSVVDETKKLIADITNSSDEVFQLVNALTLNLDHDKAVDEEINKNLEKYGFAKQVFLATGQVAKQLNKDHEDYFAESSQNLNAHNFVINGVENLEEVVYALLELYRLLYPPSN